MIVGDALEKSRLKKYSNKFYTMINHVQESIKKKMGKIFIYHNINSRFVFTKKKNMSKLPNGLFEPPNKDMP